MNRNSNHIGTGVEDVSETIKELCKMLGIKFVNNDLQHVKTFGDLCDAIINKIDLAEIEDCTSQQAFYKLRSAITANMPIIDKNQIKPSAELKNIFHRGISSKEVKYIEQSLGFKIPVLKVKRALVLYMLIGIALSILAILIKFYFGLILSVPISIFYYFKFTNRNEFSVSTIEEVVESMKLYNYFQSRRNQDTLNRQELLKIIKYFFIKRLAIKPTELNDDTLIV